MTSQNDLSLTSRGPLHVVVTGGAGYLGSVVTAQLLQAGHHVTVLDKLTYGGQSLLAFHSHKGFRLVRGDIRRIVDLLPIFDNADAVVHLAAIVGEQACAVDEIRARETNLGGTITALTAARESGVDLFVFASTCSNYGISSPGLLADEDTELNPLSEYARSKIAAESAVVDANGTPATVVFRFATLCGLSSRMRFDLLVNELGRAAGSRRSIEIFAPAAWRPFLHIRDAANHIRMTLELGAERERMAGKVFNVVGQNYQKSDLVDLIRRSYPNIQVNILDRAPDLRDYRVSGQRIRDAVGFSPALTVEDALVEVAEAVATGVFDDPFSPAFGAIPSDLAKLFTS